MEGRARSMKSGWVPAVARLVGKKGISTFASPTGLESLDAGRISALIIETSNMERVQ